MIKRMPIYKIKRLIDGFSLGKDGFYVAVPGKGFKGKPFMVRFNGKSMIIKNWLRAELFRRFPDKWGRGIYTLGYFKWRPDEMQSQGVSQ